MLKRVAAKVLSTFAATIRHKIGELIRIVIGFVFRYWPG